jgi:hypothetical protein
MVSRHWMEKPVVFEHPKELMSLKGYIAYDTAYKRAKQVLSIIA